MKKLLLILIIISFSIGCENTQKKEGGENISTNKIENETKLIVEVENAWIREYPTDGEVIAKLRTGTECVVLKKDKKETIKGKSDFWYKVNFNGKEGWIFGAQTSLKQKQKEYSIPSEVSIDKDLEYGMCRDFKCLIEEFYPMGWSENEEYFAWIFQPENEAIGGYDFTINIQNMVNDELVWIWSFKEHKLKNWDEKTRYDIVRVWNENKSIIEQKLNQYNIVQIGRKNEFKKLPGKLNNITYSARIEKRYRKNESFGYEEIGREEVYINAEGLGSKKVFQKNYGDWGINNSTLIGLIPSGNFERVAIIKLNEKRGWEGPPNILTVQIIGSHLTEGFK